MITLKKKPGLLNRASKKLSTREPPLLVINLSYFCRLLVLSQFWWLRLTCNGKVCAGNWWFFFFFLLLHLCKPVSHGSANRRCSSGMVDTVYFYFFQFFFDFFREILFLKFALCNSSHGSAAAAMVGTVSQEWSQPMITPIRYFFAQIILSQPYMHENDSAWIICLGFWGFLTTHHGSKLPNH